MTSERIISASPQIQPPLRPASKHLQALVPEPSTGPRPTNPSGTAWNNVADRVGKFPSVRLSLPSGSEEAGRTRQSQSGGNSVRYGKDNEPP